MIDRFNRKIEYLRVSLTDRCNLRCQYCMPEFGVAKMKHEDILTLEEILRVIELLAELGISKVRLTGGEPLLRRGIVNLIRDIKSIAGIKQVMLTTNGVLLDKMADDLINAGLDGVNLSLDTLDKNIFKKITRRDSFENVFGGLQKVISGGLEVKINCVPILGVNEGDILKIAALAKDNFIKVRFIELMPIGCAVDFAGVKTAKIKSQIEAVYGNLISVEKCNSLQGPAQYFSLPNFKGQIGFIDALEHKFCNSCNRIRLTAAGFLKLCLNSNDGLDVKKLLRSSISNENLIEELQKTIYYKPREHHFNENFDAEKMYQIGG